MFASTLSKASLASVLVLASATGVPTVSAETLTAHPATVKVQDLTYETDVVAGTIYGFIFDPATNTLKRTPDSPYSSGVDPVQSIVSPNGNFLYVIMGQQPPGVRGSNCFNFNTQVYSYAINHTTGALTQIQVVNLNGFCAATGGAIDPAGRYLYVGESDCCGSTGLIDVLSLGANGALSLIPGSPFTGPQIPNSLAIDGNYIYAANSTTYQSDGLLIFQRNPSTGAVQYKSGIAIAPQQNAVVAPSGERLYSLAYSGVISIFRVERGSGALVPEGTVTTGSSALQIAIDPTGHYVAVASVSGVYLYRIGFSGSLTPVSGSPFDGQSNAVAFDPTGTYLAATESYFTTAQGPLQFYKISSNGAVTPVANTPGASNPGTLSILTK